MRTIAILLLSAVAAAAQDSAPAPSGSVQPADLPSAAGRKAAKDGSAWLLKAQHGDGWWGEEPGMPPDVACTAMSGLAILSAGETAREGKARAAVDKATVWVAGQARKTRRGWSIQTRPSSLTSYLGGRIHDYLACAFLAESCGMLPDLSQDEDVRSGLRALIDRIEKAQLEDGSWNDGVEPLDTTAIAYVALRAAHNAGFSVRRASLEKTVDYVEKRFDTARGVLSDPRYGDQERFTSTAGALRVLMGLGRETGEPARLGIAILRRRPFGRDYGDLVSGEDFFGGVLGAHAMALEEGEAWTEVFGKMERVLAKCQNADGSWTGHHCISARVFCTACAVVTLEAPFRFLPMQQL
ncbi:MAG: terpene cyclase/mutase family protein [Planctomycetes bacterium]|nr:terpene cyclase/mutase family protein [Planctomycetota bacterium]